MKSHRSFLAAALLCVGFLSQPALAMTDQTATADTAATATPAASATATTTTADATALGAASTATATGGNALAPDPYAWAPEKHRVMGADGKLDEVATRDKLGAAYSELERKLGQRQPATPADKVPGDGEDYSLTGVTPPPGVTVEALRADPEMKGFLQAARAKGMTDGQVSWAVGEYLGVMGRDAQNDAATATAALRKDWATPGEYDANMGHARRAVEAYTSAEDRQAIYAAVGNNPAVVKLFARMGKELGEDRPPGTGQGQGVPAITSVAERETLMKGEAYRTPNHVDHARVQAQVRASFQRQAGNGVA